MPHMGLSSRVHLVSAYARAINAWIMLSQKAKGTFQLLKEALLEFWKSDFSIKPVSKSLMLLATCKLVTHTYTNQVP